MIFWSYSVQVCNAGYFKSEGSCVTCTGNTIKTTIGDAENCNVDEPCDGIKTVPNENRTDCGKIIYSEFNYMKGLFYSLAICVSK